MDFEWPIPPGFSDRPIWTGKGFSISGNKVSILRYTEDPKGWNYDLTVFHENEANQGNHYIDKASRRHALSQLKGVIEKQGAIILEVGSSSGFFLRDIKLKAPDVFIIGSDCISEPLDKLAKNQPDTPLIQFDLTTCPLPEHSVDAIVILNVLEHIENDQQAFKQLYRILKPGGVVVIEVPANQELYDFYDKLLRHYRRYECENLVRITEKVGFKLLYSSHLGFFIYPFFRYIKLKNKKNIDKKNTENDVKNMIQFGGPIINFILYILMLFELKLGKAIRYSTGIRCLLTLTK